jgi:hypothetical protein
MKKQEVRKLGSAEAGTAQTIPTCHYCGRQGVWDMWEHEQTCDYNPDNKTCFTCFYFLKLAGQMLYSADLKMIDCAINQAVKHLGSFQGYVRQCTAWTPGKNKGKK